MSTFKNSLHCVKTACMLYLFLKSGGSEKSRFLTEVNPS